MSPGGEKSDPTRRPDAEEGDLEEETEVEECNIYFEEKYFQPTASFEEDLREEFDDRDLVELGKDMYKRRLKRKVEETEGKKFIESLRKLKQISNKTEYEEQIKSLLEDSLQNYIQSNRKSVEENVINELRADRDERTKLLNTRAFRQKVEEVLKERREPQEDDLLVFIDINNFTDINNLFGHQAGNKILKRIGQILRQEIRVFDSVAAREGGDEFALLIKEVPTEKDTKPIKRISKLLSSIDLLQILGIKNEEGKIVDEDRYNSLLEGNKEENLKDNSYVIVNKDGEIDFSEDTNLGVSMGVRRIKPDENINNTDIEALMDDADVAQYEIKDDEDRKEELDFAITSGKRDGSDIEVIVYEKSESGFSEVKTKSSKDIAPLPKRIEEESGDITDMTLDEAIENIRTNHLVQIIKNRYEKISSYPEEEVHNLGNMSIDEIISAIKHGIIKINTVYEYINNKE